MWLQNVSRLSPWNSVLKCGHWTRQSASPRICCKLTLLGLTPDLLKWNLGTGPSTYVVLSPPADSDTCSYLKNHWQMTLQGEGEDVLSSRPHHLPSWSKIANANLEECGVSEEECSLSNSATSQVGCSTGEKHEHAGVDCWLRPQLCHWLAVWPWAMSIFIRENSNYTSKCCPGDWNSMAQHAHRAP
jgi:hypothetical protein